MSGFTLFHSTIELLELVETLPKLSLLELVETLPQLSLLVELEELVLNELKDWLEVETLLLLDELYELMELEDNIM